VCFSFYILLFEKCFGGCLKGVKFSLVFVFIFILISVVSAGIVNSSFETQSSEYNTDAFGWTEFVPGV